MVEKTEFAIIKSAEAVYCKENLLYIQPDDKYPAIIPVCDISYVSQIINKTMIIYTNSYKSDDVLFFTINNIISIIVAIDKNNKDESRELIITIHSKIIKMLENYHGHSFNINKPKEIEIK